MRRTDFDGWPGRARLYWAADVGSMAGSVVDDSAGGGLSLAGSVMSGWSAGVASLAASGAAAVEVSSVCGSSSSGSGVVSGVDVEITDSGGATSLILDGGGGTDIGSAAAPAAPKIAIKSASVTQVGGEAELIGWGGVPAAYLLCLGAR